MIGLASERHDMNGEGPDVLWVLPSRVGWVIEAKSRKKEAASFKKTLGRGQLLVAKEWFMKHYKGYKAVTVSILPQAKATKAAVADASHALTLERLAMLISDARALFTELCDTVVKR